MKRSHLLLIALFVLSVMASSAIAATNPISIDLAGTTFIVPFQKVQAVQLYDLRGKRGFAGVETVLAAWGQKDANGDRKVSLTFGAAPVLESSANVPFVAIKFRLPAKVFDTSNNSLQFGAFVGKASNQKKASYGIAASITLW